MLTHQKATCHKSKHSSHIIYAHVSCFHPVTGAQSESLIVSDLEIAIGDSLSHLRAFWCISISCTYLPTGGWLVCRLVGWLVTLSHFHCIDVSRPLQSVRRPRDVKYFLKAMTNSFQTSIFKVYFCEVDLAYASSKLCKFIQKVNCEEFLLCTRLVNMSIMISLGILRRFCYLQFLQYVHCSFWRSGDSRWHFEHTALTRYV